jgi:transposase
MAEKRKRRNYTEEFKKEAVSLARSSGNIAQVARDLGIPSSCLGNWLRQAKVDAGEGPAGALTTEEKEELRRLRKENKRLRMEREILKKATAFFAKENG